MTYTEEDAQRWDALIAAEPKIPAFVRTHKRELLRACFWMGEQLIENKGYTVEQVKILGQIFVMANLMTKDPWAAARRNYESEPTKKPSP